MRGSYSHEFMVMADSGEDAVVFCAEPVSMQANLEKAEIAKPAGKNRNSVQTTVPFQLEEVSHTGREDHRRSLQIPAGEAGRGRQNADLSPRTIKPWRSLIRGDQEVNEAKVKNYLGCESLELAGDDDLILAATGSPRGFCGRCGYKDQGHCRLFPSWNGQCRNGG